MDPIFLSIKDKEEELPCSSSSKKGGGSRIQVPVGTGGHFLQDCHDDGSKNKDSNKDCKEKDESSVNMEMEQ